MRMLPVYVSCMTALLAAAMSLAAEAQPIQKEDVSWKQTGWGGGGYFYAAAFHPTRDGVIYLGGDVAGVYKSDDHGKNFRMINNGLVNYGVFTLAVDRSNPETVYAATDGGLCKSTDGGAHWQLLPKTGPKDLRITGEKGRSIRCVAVDSTNGNIVYAASPAGKVYKSIDGGSTWTIAYQKAADREAASSVQMQFGKINAEYFGGFWTPLAVPAEMKSEDCTGLGIRFQGGSTQPRDTIVTLKTAAGVSYRSRNISEIFKDGQWREIVLEAKDFTLDADYVKKNPEAAAKLPATPDWAAVNRVDFVCVGSLPDSASVARIGRFYFATKAGAPAIAKDFAQDKTVMPYGNFRVISAAGGGSGPIYSVAVSAGDPSLVLAATNDSGLVISRDAGATWQEASAPRKASSVAVSSDTNIIYGSFFADGVWKSTDKGQSWQSVSEDLKGVSAKEVGVSPANPLDVYLIGGTGWSGAFYASHDGGKTWKTASKMAADSEGDPTLPAEPRDGDFSAMTNLTISPVNPKELFLSGNWRCAWSDNAGATWSQRNRGADISCVYDIRFSGGKTYVSVMDEGTLVSDNDGASWRQLWPLKWNKEISGHNWRVAVNNINGADRVIATCSPWDSNSNRIIRSDDGGKTYSVVMEGLPDYYPKANTMWEKGYARALAVDPKDPNIVYMGIDGDPADGKMGGGIFKSTDGGKSWKQLPNQPASRRMFFGLAVDPTNSKRIYWGGCGNQAAGLYRSEDGGESWQLVNKADGWIFNVLVTADGTVYAPGKNMFRSTDHGDTWKQITRNQDRQIVAMEVHPNDPKTMWFTATTWDGSANGAVYKTTDGGATWREITGDLPYRKPMVLRYNVGTGELWAGGVGLYKTKQ